MNVELRRRGLRRDIALDSTIGSVTSSTGRINSIFKNTKAKAIRRVFNKPSRLLLLKTMTSAIIIILRHL